VAVAVVAATLPVPAAACVQTSNGSSLCTGRVVKAGSAPCLSSLMLPAEPDCWVRMHSQSQKLHVAVIPSCPTLLVLCSFSTAKGGRSRLRASERQTQSIDAPHARQVGCCSLLPRKTRIQRS
jgi:hypothetical protein